jgi:hypothetical protein
MCRSREDARGNTIGPPLATKACWWKVERPTRMRGAIRIACRRLWGSLGHVTRVETHTISAAFDNKILASQILEQF